VKSDVLNVCTMLYDTTVRASQREREKRASIEHTCYVQGMHAR
jgi:hypothetical protein